MFNIWKWLFSEKEAVFIPVGDERTKEILEELNLNAKKNKPYNDSWPFKKGDRIRYITWEMRRYWSEETLRDFIDKC